MSNEDDNDPKDGEERVEKQEIDKPCNNNTIEAKEVATAQEVQPISIPMTSTSNDTMSTLQIKVDDVLKEEIQKEKPKGDPVTLKVVYNKVKYDVEFPIEGTIKQLKEHLYPIINVLPKLMKIMIKGLAKDEKTLNELGVVKGSKIMVVGSKLNDVVQVNAPKSEVIKSEASSSVSQREPLCRQKIHRKVLDKGPPDDVTPGIKNCKEPMPPHPISGMVNKSGGKVRLTFKLELDQIWIGTKERTEKVAMGSINQIVSEKIENHEEYHMLALQLGPTEASRYWIYWVPAQYVDGIKETVLGKW